MDKKRSFFISLFQSEKKKFLIIIITIIITSLIAFASFFSKITDDNNGLDASFFTHAILSIIFLGVYFSIPQLIASKKSEKYRRYLYLKSGKKILSLITSIFLYFSLCIFIITLFSINIMAIASVSNNEELWAYSFIGISSYVFIIWFVSFIIGITSLVINSLKSEKIIINGKISFKFYLSPIITIFISILLLFIVFIMTFGKYL